MSDSNPAENPSYIVLQLHRIETQPLSHTAASATSHRNSKNFTANCDIVEQSSCQVEGWGDNCVSGEEGRLHVIGRLI